MALDRKEALDHFFRIILRMLPFVPGPELYDLALDITRSQSQLDAQIADAVAGLKKSASLITTLEAQVNERAEKLVKLQEEHARLSALSSISAEQVKALSQQIDAAIGRSKRWETVKALAINLVAGLIIFILGIFASDWVKHFFFR